MTFSEPLNPIIYSSPIATKKSCTKFIPHFIKSVVWFPKVNLGMLNFPPAVVLNYTCVRAGVV